MFARYAYPPNELGYCGPSGAAAMLRPDAAVDIERRARQFEGAWSYLEFIAESVGIADPLDAQVVEAYWVGNELLEQVEPDALVRRLRDRFRGQSGATWQDAWERASAHHSFHVYEVYPWARLLAAGSNPTALSVLDRCRIRTGIVVGVDGETATVESRPLAWDGPGIDGPVLSTGPVQEEVVRWSTDGMSLIGRLEPGDRVALHWDWVCDVVTDQQAELVGSLDSRCRARLQHIGSVVNHG